MAFTQTDLNSIRETVMCHRTTSAKLRDFASRCQDEKLRGMLTNASNEASKSADRLMQML